MRNLNLKFSPLLQSIFDHSNKWPDKVAIYTVKGDSISYSSLWINILLAASLLRQFGIQKGHKVLISANKEVEFLYYYFAVHLIGGVNVVVDASNSVDHLNYIRSVVNPSVSVGFKLMDLASINYTDFGDARDLDGFDFVPSDISINDPADIMFTSGTTGNPKGVILSHFNIFSAASNINGFIGNSEDAIEFIGLPICHSFGLGRVRCCLLLGATIVLHNGFANLKSVFDCFEKYNISGFGMVPAVFSYIKKFSGNRIGNFASQIKYIEIGSASMTLDDKLLLCKLFPQTRICMHYGLTEASRAVFMELHENDSNLTIAGKVVNDKVKLKILDSNGNELPEFTEGEIAIRGNMVSNSYFLEEENKDCFIDGYFKTGDWGFLDEKGQLTLIGRKKEMINVGGKKVSPIEIEEVLFNIGIGECMCMSMPDPNGILGEVPKVLLVKGSFTLSLEEIKHRLSTILPPYKLPRQYELVESIPKTESGKKKRT